MVRNNIHKSIVENVLREVKRRLNEIQDIDTRGEKEGILDEIDYYLELFPELGINTFQCEKNVNPLNRLFGFSEKSYPYGVHSIWMGGGADRISITVFPNGYSGKEVRYDNPMRLKIHILEGILEYIRNLVENRKKNIEGYKNNIPLEQFLKNAESFAKQCLEKVEGNYTASLSYGKRQTDYSSYSAIVIKEDGDYIGHIKITQDRFGAFHYNVMKPLSGEYLESPEINSENMESEIKEAIEYIIGSRITI